MSVATKYFNWGKSGLDWDADPYEDMAPALISLFRYLEARWGGDGYGLDDYDRPIRGGTTPSTHAYGRALDWRWKAHPDVQARAFIDLKTLRDEVIPFLVDNSAELGIQHIMVQSSGWSGGNSWLPPAYRDGRGQSHDGGWIRYENTYDGWIHIEVHPDHDMDARSVEEKLGGAVTPEPETAWPPYDPPRQFGLWPVADKPRSAIGAQGGHVRYAQDVMNKWGANITADGVFGTQTHAAVVNVQKFWGLAVDGVIGRQTWPVLDFLAGWPR